MLYFTEAKTRNMHEIIHVMVEATKNYKDEIQMLAICPLAMFIKRFGYHLLKVGT